MSKPSEDLAIPFLQYKVEKCQYLCSSSLPSFQPTSFMVFLNRADLPSPNICPTVNKTIQMDNQQSIKLGGWEYGC